MSSLFSMDLDAIIKQYHQPQWKRPVEMLSQKNHGCMIRIYSVM